MGLEIPWLDDRVESFVMAYWNTEARGIGSSDSPREDLEIDGIRDQVRRFLLDVIQRDAVSPHEWMRLCNVYVRTADEVREDAMDFWDWLFDGEPLPGPAGRG